MDSKSDAATGSGLTAEDLKRAAAFTLVGYDSDPERLRGMVDQRAEVIGILLKEIDRLRADQERHVTALETIARKPYVNYWCGEIAREALGAGSGVGAEANPEDETALQTRYMIEDGLDAPAAAQKVKEQQGI